MYAVIVMFALALLSPLPFISPFTSVYADELPFQTQPSSNIPTFDSPVKTSAIDGSVELVASQIAPGTVAIKAMVDDEPSFAIVANSSEIPFDFPTDVFSLSGSDNDGNAITNENSESWFAHEHVEYSFIQNGTPNLPPFVNPVSQIPFASRLTDEGLRFGDSMANLGDIDGDGIDDIAIGATGDGDVLKYFRTDDGGTIVKAEYLARNQGALHILLMNDDGTIKSSTKFDHTTRYMPSLATDFLPFDAEFASAVVSLGDLYNDGTTVIAVGTPTYATVRESEGAVFIMHIGDNGTTLLDVFVIQLKSYGINLVDESKFGSSLANIGDVDNNGVPDLAVGTNRATLGTSQNIQAGAVFILHLGENATSVLKVASNISSHTNIHPLNQIALDSNWFFGNSVELLETYDDGTISLAIGAPSSGPTTNHRIGSIYIVNMTNEATIVSSIDIIDYTTPGIFLNERNYNVDGLHGIGADGIGGFGFSMQNLGDLNGNGVNDILVGHSFLNSIGGAYILYMNSDNSIQHVAKFQIDRIESKIGTAAILADDQDQIDEFRKYFNYSDPPNMPTSMFQSHYNTLNGDNTSDWYFEFGTAVLDFGDVHDDGYTDIALSSIGHNSGTILVLNRLGPIVNVTFDPATVDTIHYRPTATDFITVNGIELHNDLDIIVDNKIMPTIVNTTLQSPGTFTITFDNDIDASSVSINDFTINGIVYTGTVSVSGTVVTLNVDGVFTTDVANTVSIVDEVLDLLGNAVALMHSSSTVPMETMNIEASRIDKNTIILNFTNISSLSSDNTDVNAFLVTDATVASWSITGTVITITTSGLTGTHETPIVVYDPSHSTNLATSTAIVDDYISITVVDKIPPEYTDALITYITTLEIKFSEQLSTVPLYKNNFTIDPDYVIISAIVMNDSLVLNTEHSIIQAPTVTYSALITDSIGNSKLESNVAVLATDAIGPTPVSARTVDINKINLVFHEEFTETVFDKYSIEVSNLEVKDVIKLNQTVLQLRTEQFSTNYIPGNIRIATTLTDNGGTLNQFGHVLSDDIGNLIRDGVGPIPYALYPGDYPVPNTGNAQYDDFLNAHQRAILFAESMEQVNPPSTSITIYDASGLPLPNEHQFHDVIKGGNLIPTVIKGQNNNYDLATVGISFMNITDVIRDQRDNHVKLGTILPLYDFEIPILTSANIIDDNTITVMFDKIIDYSTVSIQDFTVNNTITISDVLTRGDTVYLTTDSLLPGESYNVSLVGSVADYFNNATNTTSIAILYETVVAENFTITSSNANPTYAKSGDTLTINLTIDETLTSASATVLENNVQYASTDKTITINTVVPENAVDGFATFAIYVETVNGSTRTFAQNDLTGNSNVLIDNTNPSFVSSSYDFDKLVHFTFSENISTASAYEHDNNNEILTTINGPVVTLNTSLIQNTSTIINATVYDYAGNSYSHLPTNIDSLISLIKVSSLNITNNGTSIARANQNITVTLVTDGTDLDNFAGILLGKNIADTNPSTVTVNTDIPGTAIFTTTVLSTDTNGNITFSITATNSSASQLVVTNENITDGSFVTVDTVKPIITLVGNPPYTALQGDSYTDPSTTVSDPDNPSYSEITTITKNLDTSILGAQNITYSAPPDAAGNIPDPINRTVTVLAKPLGIDTLTITSTNSENSLYATTGDTITITLDANGTIGSATTISIASIPLTPAIISDSLTATYVVNSSLADTTNLEFTITAYNEDNKTSRTFTATNLDDTSTNIIIDKTSPTIVLIGATNVTIPTDSTTYNIANATASDLSYAGDITIGGTSTDFDITTPGNYTFTYKAPNDAAGNLGPSIPRYVEVKNTPPIGITTFIISTTNIGYAKAGDDINFFLLVNNTIEGNNYTFNIPNTSVKNERISGNELYIDVTVLNNTIESNATFTITVENENGTSLTLTENNLTGSNIFIDTEPPRVTPESGTVNYSIVNGTDNPVIRDVTVTDGDPKYPGNYTLTTNGTVNADINGSIYNYTYTAVADGAGNPGGSLTRIITIIDADPITVTYLSITSSPGDPDFANEGKTITVTLETDGSDIGNFTGTLLGREFTSATSGGTATFTTTVFSNDTNGPATFSIVATNSSGNRIFVTNVDTNDSSSVIIDTIKPIITLNPNSPDDVFEGESYPTLSATASDHNNASYNPTVTATTLDTSILGAQNITYSAPPDAAGNIPDPVNRIVTVLAKPLGIDTLTITSTNSENSLYATTGDTITITLDANGTIGSATTISIASILLTPAIISDSLTATYVVNSSLADTTNLGFTITAYNEDNKTSRTFTATNLDDTSTNIIIDKTSPTIVLIGATNVTIPTDSTTYNIANATASDLSYAGDITIGGTSNDFDITTPGNYTFTYKAPNDAAGNLGPSIPRYVEVKNTPPIGITTFTIEANTGYAKAGDTINFYLVVNNTIEGNNYTFDIPNTALTNDRISGKDLYIDVTVLNNTIESNATFTITVENENGTSLTLTENELTGPNIFIDTESPRITPESGTANYFIVNGTEPIIRNVTVTDGDPNYSGNYTLVTPNGPVNADINGSVYNYTYTAVADGAGNLGDSLTRIITIIDAPLIGITSLSITSSPGNPNFANEGKIITLSLVTDSNDLGNFTGTLLGREFASTTSGGTATFTTTVSSSDTNGNVTFSIVATNSSGGRVSLTEANLGTDSFVTVDTISPIITLVGENNTIVALDANYTDRGATIADQDNPSYAGTITTTPATLDTSSTGNKTITYTAPADAAGNVPDSITRIVSVKDSPPIDISLFTLSGNNGIYAKEGDSILVELSINYTIASYTIMIFNKTTSVASYSSDTITLTETVPNDITVEEYATISLTIIDGDGLPTTLTQEDLTSGNIFVDTIRPRITPDGGSANYSIINGTDNPVIRNVTVTDGDPNYSYNYTLITPNGLVNADINGSIYNYTYTAVADGAGNPGASVSRIITIIDALPIGVTSLSITSNSGNNFANAGKIITLSLETDSNDLGSITGTLLGREFTSTINGGSATFTTTVLSNDTNGNVTFSIEATNSSDGRVSISESDLDLGSFVTIDTIAPNITLNDNNNTIIPQGVESYEDLGAISSDLSYATDKQLVGIGYVDYTRVGNYTLVYTDTDAAGNKATSILNVVVLAAPPIDIETLTIRNGANASSSYVKAGDDLTIQLSINYTIASYTATIFGIEQSESNQNSKGFLISQQVPSDIAVEEYATFTITIVDEKGLPNTITQNTLITSSQLPPENVFVDTISPTVKLSTQQISISVNDPIPDITATITDEDPNYGEKTITINGSTISAFVNTSTAEVYPFTYTAPDDNAGNPGQSAAINIIVKNINQTGTTILNSSIITNKSQTFTDVKSIIAKIHNDTNPNNTLSLDAPTLELDVSNITVTNTIGTTVVHTTTYPHSLDLTVKSGLSVQIEPNVTMDFDPKSLNSSNFTVRHVDDGPNPDTIQLGLEGVRYNLTGSALGIAFEGVSSSYQVYIREDPDENYELINTYNNTVVTNGTNASLILDQNPTYYRGVMYTYDPNLRIGTVWTLHLSNLTGNGTSSGGDESSSNSPTLGKTSSGAQLVTNGFQYNGLTVNVDRYHTEFPLIGTNVGDINTISMKIYDSAGPTGIKRVEFALGVPDIGLYHEAEAFVEVWMQRDSVAVQETIIVDELNLLEDSDVSATVSQTSCSGGEQQCLLVELQYSYREPPAYNTISIKPVDWDNNAHQFYFNDGIHVDGDSINLPKEITISASHATDTTHAGETLHLVQIDRAEHLWVDQYGYQWKIIGNTVRQITVPEYLVPDDNTYGKLHGPDRNHPEFASSVYAEQQKAQETLAEILGHATILKPLPENGGTIYFDATGTDSRSGDSFKLLLELETARMHQLANLLYDDTN